MLCSVGMRTRGHSMFGTMYPLFLIRPHGTQPISALYIMFSFLTADKITVTVCQNWTISNQRMWFTLTTTTTQTSLHSYCARLEWNKSKILILNKTNILIIDIISWIYIHVYMKVMHFNIIPIRVYFNHIRLRI